jgi:DMSO/TMAO reductase YedYZ molybdopterin-dependent catalytic subunit
MSNPERRLDRLPVFDRKKGRSEQWMGLWVDGLVTEPRNFTKAELDALTDASLTEDFRCEEGWRVDNQHWEGVSLAKLLQLVRPLPTARYAEISAAGYSVALPLQADDASSPEEATSAHALLANRLGGASLPEAHGGPCRLVIAGAIGYTSVKWVDHIRLTAERPDGTAVCSTTEIILDSR